MVIIIDDKEKNDISKVHLSDDGTGQGIRIPAVLISKKDGDKIVDWIVHASPGGQRAATMGCLQKGSYLQAAMGARTLCVRLGPEHSWPAYERLHDYIW